jgi:hypothetical protein
MDYDKFLSDTDRASKISITRQRGGRFDVHVAGAYVGQTNNFLEALDLARRESTTQQEIKNENT